MWFRVKDKKKTENRGKEPLYLSKTIEIGSQVHMAAEPMILESMTYNAIRSSGASILSLSEILKC